ncbi:MAG: hypothetical protein D6806_00125 [Deltaproteobacteria bacterium]|nr:MAG: hypothetical protein D6806_00125 [Deltaproteobacteria bacterium]
MSPFLRYGSFIVAILAATSVPACTEKGVEMADGGKARGKLLTVDSSGDAGQYVAMDIDINDNVHLAYYDKKNRQLKYVQWSPRGLATEVIDSACRRCLFATIRATANGEPHVAYYSDSTKTFTYAYRDDDGWHREPIEWGEGNGMGAKLLFDDSWQLHALYYSGDGYLKHAWRVAVKSPAVKCKKKKRGECPPQPKGLWDNERVDKANGSEHVLISFVKQPDGRLAATYLHWSGLSSELRLAERQPDGTWKKQVITREENPGKASFLFYDEDGNPEIIFRQAMKNRLCLAKQDAQGWKITPLIPDAYNMAVSADAQQNLLVAYEHLAGTNPLHGHLRYALRQAGKWTSFVLDESRGSGTHVAAALTSESAPVIAYYEEKSHSLKLFLGSTL